MVTILLRITIGQSLRAFKQSNIPLNIAKQWAKKYPHNIVFIVLQSVK